MNIFEKLYRELKEKYGAERVNNGLSAGTF